MQCRRTFWWLFRNPSQPSKLSNDLYIESATIDAISGLFQNWTFLFHTRTPKESISVRYWKLKYSHTFNSGPDFVRGHIVYHSMELVMKEKCSIKLDFSAFGPKVEKHNLRFSNFRWMSSMQLEKAALQIAKIKKS